MNWFPDKGEAACAFFDVDGTLIRIKSMFSFADYLFEQLRIARSPAVIAYRETMQAMMRAGAAREELNRFYYSIYAGLEVAQVAALGRQWYALHCRENVFYPDMRNEIRRHQERGTRIVLVSGSFDAVLRPLAEELKIDGIIAAPLETREERYTGMLTGPSTIGEGKAEGMRAYAKRHALSLADCYAYGDDISDLPMLDSVGKATVVNPDAALLAVVHERGWNFMCIA